MADTIRSNFPDNYCCHCGAKGCHILHWGDQVDNKHVNFDNCILLLGYIPKEEIILFESDSGILIEEKRKLLSKIITDRNSEILKK